MRKTLVLVLLGLGLSLGAILAFATPALCADDWWYADVNGHWASDYIYLLWSEESPTASALPQVTGSTTGRT